MKYAVTLKTLLGDRHGVLEMERSGQETRGMLHILGHGTELHGSIAEDSKCRLEGMLNTLIASRPFVAEGRIDDHALSLLLRGQDESWTMTGECIR